ncbi:MAG: hypothetical protein KDD70_15055 [Bdellovibrionales bacterium]|nr:hypothetical protein [Bdellovibrionales bacterium]
MRASDSQREQLEKGPQSGDRSSAKYQRTGMAALGFVLAAYAFTRVFESDAPPSPVIPSPNSAHATEREQEVRELEVRSGEPRQFPPVRSSLLENENLNSPNIQLEALLYRWEEITGAWDDFNALEKLEVVGQIADLYEQLGQHEDELQFRFEELRVAQDSDIPVALERVSLFVISALKSATASKTIVEQLDSLVSEEQVTELSFQYPDLGAHLDFFRIAADSSRDHGELLNRGYDLLLNGLSGEFDAHTKSAALASVGMSLLKGMKSAPSELRYETMEAAVLIERVANSSYIPLTDREDIWLSLESFYGENGGLNDSNGRVAKAVHAGLQALGTRLEAGELDDQQLDRYARKLGRWRADENLLQEIRATLQRYRDQYPIDSPQGDFLSNLAATL